MHCYLCSHDLLVMSLATIIQYTVEHLISVHDNQIQTLYKQTVVPYAGSRYIKAQWSKSLVLSITTLA